MIDRDQLARAQWHKSSRSGGGGEGGGDCVEAASLDGLRLVRDSKNPSGPVLAFTPTEWATFLGSVKHNWHDRS